MLYLKNSFYYYWDLIITTILYFRAQDASKNGTVGDNELVNGISNSSAMDPTSSDKIDTTESSKLTNSNGHFPSN